MIIDVVDLNFETLQFNRRYDPTRYRKGTKIYNQELVEVETVNKVDENNYSPIVTIIGITVNKEDDVCDAYGAGQNKMSEICQNLYTGMPFTSDLVNSYAWDTAIMFVENFGGNPDYANMKSVNNGENSMAIKGTDSDKISNIYDMASNCFEITTETCWKRNLQWYVYQRRRL